MSPIPGSRRLQVLTVVLDLLLLTVVIGAPVYAFHVLELPDADATPSAVAGPLPDVALVLDGCGGVTEEWRMDCFLSALYPILDSHGVAAAFEMLYQLSIRDNWVLQKDHPLAHSLGREAFLRLEDPSKVLVECPYGMASGCFHGTLEAYLSTRTGEVTGDDVRFVCAKVGEVRGPFGHFQCLHGLGHGLTMHGDHNLTKALLLCDELPDWWTRESCYGGVFMENIVSYQVWSGLGVGEGILHNHDDEDGEVHHGWIYVDDPQYPCNVVEDKYVGSCYNLQTTAFLTLNNYNVVTAFELCNQAREDWIHMCYLSMGRDISSISQRVKETASSQCGWGDPKYRAWCIVGVVKDFINSSGFSAPGFEFCKVVLDEDKPMCYKAAGEILITLIPDRSDRWQECGLVEADYMDDCRSGAAL